MHASGPDTSNFYKRHVWDSERLWYSPHVSLTTASCHMTSRGSARPRRSRLATRIDLQRLGEKRSRKLAEGGQHVPALRRTIWRHWARHSGTCAECRAREGHLWRQSAGTQEQASARSDCILRKSKPFLTGLARYEMQQAPTLSDCITANHGNPCRSALKPES